MKPIRESEGVQSYLMPQAMIQDCPWVILVPEHYRDDMTCRCDDPTHTEMIDWGYVWDGGKWTYNEE